MTENATSARKSFTFGVRSERQKWIWNSEIRQVFRKDDYHIRYGKRPSWSYLQTQSNPVEKEKDQNSESGFAVLSHSWKWMINEYTKTRTSEKIGGFEYVVHKNLVADIYVKQTQWNNTCLIVSHKTGYLFLCSFWDKCLEMAIKCVKIFLT